ncbi:MAG: hypothetical protein ACREVZ_14030 [Burkholderiales bacterium]
MTIQDLGAFGALISSLFMPITLIYLAMQVTYLKRQVQMQATFSRGQGAREILMSFANSDYLPQIIQKMRSHHDLPASLVRKHLMDDWGLEAAEAVRVNLYYFAWMRNQESIFGNISSHEQEPQDLSIANFGDNPGFQVWWTQSKVLFKAAFSQHVDSILAQVK